MILTHKIYDELANEIKNTSHRSLSRMYGITEDVYLIFAIDQLEEKRKMYFPILQDNIAMLPECKGIETNKVHLYEYSKTNFFCEIAQSDKSDTEVFEIIIDDIRKQIDSVTNVYDILSKVSSVLLKWKTFFLQKNDMVLSHERQQGLYGELLFLENLVNLNNIAYVQYWTGADFETHDFYIKDDAFEIKTTSKKEPYKMHISSEYQLDGKEVKGHIYVVFYALRKSTVNGESLPDIIMRLREECNDNILMRKKLDEKLEKYGYFDGLEHKYTDKYTIRDIKSFKVEREFPKIIVKGLPVGISNCTYDILVDSCVEYAVAEDEMKKVISGGKKYV